MADMPIDPCRYWIAVVAEERALQARAGGYAELNHGRAGILALLRRGDGFLTYAPRVADPKGAPVQAFITLGYALDGTLYQTERPDGTAVFRVAIEYVDVQPAPIRPLLDHLTFIRNRQHWGAAFRFGALRIPPADFGRIARAMGHPPGATAARAA